LGRDKERGIVLLIVLWVVMLLSVIALSLSASTRSEVRTVGNRVEAARAQAFAEAGVNRAILALLTTDPAERWVADGRIYDMAFVGQRVQVLIQDERGKIDLNTGTAELLRGLFAASGLTAEESDALTDAILDWRDEDDLRRLNGAEDADYRDAGLPYGAKNAPFDTVEELQQVLGMTLALFSRVEPALTVYSQQAGVDMTTAPAEVLRALPGMDPDAVEAILAARVAGAQQGAKSEPAVAGDAGTGRPAIGLAGRVYTVRARVRTEKGAVFIRDAIVRLTGNAEKPYWIHAWKQGRWENQADRETLPAANG
jgi:general secretion pathway protein K